MHSLMVDHTLVPLATVGICAVIGFSINAWSQSELLETRPQKGVYFTRRSLPRNDLAGIVTQQGCTYSREVSALSTMPP